MTDITTLNRTQTPLDVYEAIQEAIRHGKVEFDFLRDPSTADEKNPFAPPGKAIATLVSAWTRVGRPDLPECMRPSKMLRWWVPIHGGGTRLVATAGHP
jgi:hypothetical protein